AAFVGILHWIHLTTLFENDRHFSHLSTLEREMSFRNEMGLYYSYFKTLIEAPSFLEGLWMIMNDRLTEYPLVINAVKRFHLYPEVVLAYWYRTFTGITNLFGIETKACWNVTRVGFPSEIESCEGLGDPACFYVGAIFILNGVMVGLFFIYATYLSGSQLGGLLTVLCYFFNHGEATRVMWTPPLRESFAYPFLVLQMYILTMSLRISKNYGQYYIALCLANVAFMLPWGFAQFILFTQLIQGGGWWLGTIILQLVTSEILGVSDHLVFHTLQLLAFAALAILILRLKLFLTPHMCVMASLICSRRLFGWLFQRFRFESVIFGILAAMSIQGCANLHNQWSIRGEFTNMPQEELLLWIKYNTRPDAVFAGTMQTMASIKLSTQHPIVNHPHYEDADLRLATTGSVTLTHVLPAAGV
ncbi:Protein dpy-19 like protein 2, partial [Fukomys damarensis]